jgi:hypothetical protein
MINQPIPEKAFPKKWNKLTLKQKEAWIIEYKRKTTIPIEKRQAEMLKDLKPQEDSNLLSKYEKKADFQEKTMLEPKSEDFTPKPIKDFKASWTEDKEKNVIEQQSMTKTRYVIESSPMRRFISNISEIKLYYDIEKDAYYFYVFSSDRNRILKRIRIDEHDILTMLAFAIAEIYGDKAGKLYPCGKPFDFKVTKKLRRQINGILAKIETIGLEKVVI